MPVSTTLLRFVALEAQNTETEAGGSIASRMIFNVIAGLLLVSSTERGQLCSKGLYTCLALLNVPQKAAFEAVSSCSLSSCLVEHKSV